MIRSALSEYYRKQTNMRKNVELKKKLKTKTKTKKCQNQNVSKDIVSKTH